MATTDFVMPKLGLTMTEGTVARWDVAPGSRFAAGDVIVVVETDKIAYDVEAPGPGTLQEVLVSAGGAVPVGTPIGRWDIGDINVSLDAPGIEPDVDSPAAAPTAVKVPIVTSAPRPCGERERILATPFARCLARRAGIDLRNLNGTGPKGRIKAADVEHAVAIARAAVPPAAAIVNDQSRAAVHRAGVAIDVTALLALNEEINRDLPDLHSDLAHYIVLAAAKISEAFFGEAPVIGLAPDAKAEAGTASVFASADCRTLRSVIAQIASSAVSDASTPRGTLWIERALPGISFFSADPPGGWAASLNIGSRRDAFRLDADGRSIRVALVDVFLSCRVAELDPVSAQRLLLRIRQLLEAPLFLLAS
jgi:pyruvate dehydrogenase E2 component (dihydrolipoyllysine-residue acetyltransferase)